jgi:hypothetical protein
MAGKQHTTAQDLIAEKSVQPMARQVMLEQEAAKRAGELETNVAQAGLEGSTVKTSSAVDAIRADAAATRPITSLAKRQQRELNDLASTIAKSEEMSVGELDDAIQQLDAMVNKAKAGKAPFEHIAKAKVHLRNLRDNFANVNEQTVADVQVPDKGLFTAAPEDTLVEPAPREIAGIRDAHGNVKPVEGYSQMKAKQHRDMVLREFSNSRALGGGAFEPTTLKALPVMSKPTVDKGIFNPQTPEEIVGSITPKVDLSVPQHNAIKGNIRSIGRTGDPGGAEEIRSLACRVGPGMEKKLEIIQQLDDADALASALGRTINGVSARGGNVGAFFDRKQLFRAVPTLKSMGGGLPGRPSGVASDSAVKRLKEFVKLRVMGAGDPVPGNPVEVMPRPSKDILAGHQKAMRGASAAVTPQEQEAVKRFTHGYDQTMRGLQQGKRDAELAAGHPRGEQHVAEARESLPHLESYIKKMPPAREVPYVYRGIALSKADADAMLKQGIISADPSGKAVTSVSADPIVARSHATRNTGDGQVGIQLKLKHRSAVGASPFASEQMKVEKELLLPGSARFRVTKRYADKSQPGQYIIEAEETAPLGEAAGEVANKVVGAAKAGAKAGGREAMERFRGKKDKQTTFMPDMPSLNMRGGLPSRVIGGARDDSERTEPDFSPEEEAFWLKVIDNLSKDTGK